MRVPSAERPVLSKIVDVDRLPDRGLDLTIGADAATCAALAAANSLQAVRGFEARLHVARHGRAGVRVTGTVEGDVTQVCVVSLEPFESHVREELDVDFTADAAPAHSGDPLSGDHDPPDPIVGGRIDVGALAAEFLTLSLDPYPRKPGVRFDDAGPADTRDPSPFAALARLKGAP